MPVIIELMKDPSTIVRDSAAWTVGRVCDLLPEEAINPAYLEPLLGTMLECLSAEPRVAANSCWVIILSHPIATNYSIIISMFTLFQIISLQFL